MENKILEELQTTTDKLLNLLSLPDQEQLNKIPFEGSWTAGQVGDHLLKSYNVTETLNGPVKKADREAGQKIKPIKDLFLNFDIKLKPPPSIIPSNDVINKEALINSLKHKISELLIVTNTKSLSEICTSVALPVFGELSRCEWLYFVVYHTQRHSHQLNNILKVLKAI